MMRWRRCMLGFVALLAIAAGLGGAPIAHASVMSAQPAALHMGKVRLGETSVSGPAMTTADGQTILAWTGTDAAHHLNVMTSADGTHFHNKLTLSETSFTRPAVVIYQGRVVVAWTGRDASHSLNVLYDVYGASPRKLTLRNERSLNAPGIEWMWSISNMAGPDYLLLAWTGTDTNHSLNVQRINITAGLTLDTKRTLSPQYSSASDLTLGEVSPAPSTKYLLLSWAARAPANRLKALRSMDGLTWQSFLPTTLASETSGSAPIMQGNRQEETSGVVNWAWTGQDSAHTLNLLLMMPLPETPTVGDTHKVILRGETAVGGPSLTLNDTQRQFLLAWTGTDAAHHLNVMAIDY